MERVSDAIRIRSTERGTASLQAMNLRDRINKLLIGYLDRQKVHWVFPDDPESGEAPRYLGQVKHPPGWAAWPADLKALHRQLLMDRESAVGLIVHKNRLYARANELFRILVRATDPAEVTALRERIDALIEPLRSAERAVEDAKISVKQQERNVRLAILSHSTFQITDINLLSAEQRLGLERQLDEHESEAKKRWFGESD
ncbi:MAG: hypothetical protein K1X67_16320 [Fimbriimonadaceae bacterium]|nr:hypothetical protein [Fimbriimonadaceae bacterium]